MEAIRARDIGRSIRARRLELGWSQTKLAEQVETTRRWISEIEHGKATAEIGLVLATLHALGITVRLEPPTARGEPRKPGRATSPHSGAADLAGVLSRHVEPGAHRTRSVTFLRTNR